MEGSRHERVAIVAAAYVIGFITAFIAFGLNQEKQTAEFVYVPVDNTAALADAVGVSKVGTTALTDNGLMYIAGGEETLLSTPAGDQISDLVDGLYTTITQHEVSPDGQYVYFCEVPVVGVDSCKPFVYSVDNKIVYPVTVSGERIAVSTKKQDLVWTEIGLRTIGNTAVDALP